jgi:carbamoyl-phosphate synthase large subunit
VFGALINMPILTFTEELGWRGYLLRPVAPERVSGAHRSARALCGACGMRQRSSSSASTIRTIVCSCPKRSSASAHGHHDRGALHPDHRRRADRDRPGCEFDYSGVAARSGQACQGAAGSEGYRRHPGQLEPRHDHDRSGLADATYIEPITPEMVEKIIEKEKPDALLPTMGGQTALNCALDAEQGALKKHGVEMIGAKAEVIEKAEDRLLFREAMDKIGLESPRSRPATRWRKRLRHSSHVHGDVVGLPAIIRPSFTLGGTGRRHRLQPRGIRRDRRTRPRCRRSAEVLIEEAVLGWKEYEMEVVRDKADNCIIICSIENIDPMGVHTGDSITVAPALTLTDKEYQIMRNASIAVLREIGVETGGSNVQFAVNPKRWPHGRHRDEPARVAFIGARFQGHRLPDRQGRRKLAVGYTLDELDQRHHGGRRRRRSSRRSTTSSPRFRASPSKVPGADPTLTTSMKSVGEAMAIGRTFPGIAAEGAALA